MTLSGSTENHSWSFISVSDAIPIGEKLGEIRGKKEGKRETIKLAVRKSFHRLRSLGIDEKQAFQYICEDYPELTDKKIRRILSV